MSLVVDASIAIAWLFDDDLTAAAHTVMLRVVAEGVETREQLTFLEENACPEAQGYLFSRPVDALTFEQGLRGEFLHSSAVDRLR